MSGDADVVADSSVAVPDSSDAVGPADARDSRYESDAVVDVPAPDVIDAGRIDAPIDPTCPAAAKAYGALWCRSLRSKTSWYSLQTVGPRGETIVANDVVYAVDSDGAMLWSYAPPTRNPLIAIDPSGAFSTAAPWIGSIDDVHDPRVIERRDPSASVLWSKSVPHPFGFSPGLVVLAVATDRAGRTIVLGTHAVIDDPSGVVDLGGGPLPFGASFIISFESDGRVRWQRALGYHVLSNASTLATAPDGDVVMGATLADKAEVGGPMPVGSGPFSHDQVFVRWHDDGAFAWSKTYPGEGGSIAPTLAISPTDGRIVYFSDVMHMTALDASGRELWRKAVSSTPGCSGTGVARVGGSIAFDPHGALHVAGQWQDAGCTITFGGPPISAPQGFVVDLDENGAFLGQVTGAIEIQDYGSLSVAPDATLRVLDKDGLLMKLPAR